MNKLFIGLDIGTSAVKGVLYSAGSSAVVFSAKSSFDYITDDNGRVEIAAEDYLTACFTVLSKLAGALPQGCDIAGICAASASGNLLLLDENHEPLTNIINWQNKVSEADTVSVLGENFDYGEYYTSTGWQFDRISFPLASLCAIKRSNPSLLGKAGFITMSTEYLIYKLTGFSALGISEGTPFYLIDQSTRKYRRDMLGILGIPEDKLPPIVKTGEIIGYISSDASVKTGLKCGIPVFAGTFDHPSAARGAGVLKQGELLLSCGTSWVGFFPVLSREDAVKANTLVDPFLSEEGGPWGAMVSLASVSSKIEEYVRKYVSSKETMFADFQALSAESKRGANGLTLNMNNDDEALIMSHPKSDVARAIMECVAKMLGDNLKRLSLLGIKAENAVMVGGPSESETWKEVIAYTTGLNVTLSSGAFTGAVGAALIASQKSFV